MKKPTAKRTFLGVESLERRELLSGTTLSSMMPALTAPSTASVATAIPVVTDTAYLLVPSVGTTSGSTVPVTFTKKIQIIVPPEVLTMPVTIGSSTLPGEAKITLQFNEFIGPVDVQLDAKTPQDQTAFLDYIESGAFNDTLFARLALGTSSSSTPAVSHAMVNPNGSLTLTGGTTLTLSPTALTSPTTLLFEFDTSSGPAVVQLNGAQTPRTVANFMKSIESGAINAALLQRLPSVPQTGSTLPVNLQASVTDGCIILEGGNTGSSDTILLPDGTTVNLPLSTQSDGTNPTAQTVDNFIDYTERKELHSKDDTTLISEITSLAAKLKAEKARLKAEKNGIFAFIPGFLQVTEDTIAELKGDIQKRLDVLNQRVRKLHNHFEDLLAAQAASPATDNALQNDLQDTLRALDAAEYSAALGDAAAYGLTPPPAPPTGALIPPTQPVVVAPK